MRLFATREIEGTLVALPDARLAPTPFAEMADARADSVGAKLDAFLEAVGLTRQQAATATSLTTETAQSPAPVPFYKTTPFLVGAAIVAAWVLHEKGVI